MNNVNDTQLDSNRDNNRRVHSSLLRRSSNGGTKSMTANEIVFLMGTPAAGKSTTAREMFSATHTIIDCDEFKKEHPDYDPKRPHLVHEYSRKRCDATFEAAIESRQGRWVVDGTGANAERMVTEIKRARKAGFATRLVYVRCSLETSLRRNARRERNVLEVIVREKAKFIATSFEIVSHYVDAVETIENDTDKETK